jgi:hypothetical protein
MKQLFIAMVTLVAPWVMPGCNEGDDDPGAVVLSFETIHATFCNQSFAGSNTTFTVTNNLDEPVQLLRVTISSPEAPPAHHLVDGTLSVEPSLTLAAGEAATLDCGNGIVVEAYDHFFADAGSRSTEFEATATVEYSVPGELAARVSTATVTIDVGQAWDNCGNLTVPDFACHR